MAVVVARSGYAGLNAKMDTNDLTEKAYEILGIAEDIDHLITVLIGSLAIKFSDENEYLYGILYLLSEIKEDPEEFIYDWGISNEIDIQTLKDGLLRLEEYIKEVIDTPIEKRGITIEERYYR